MRGFSVLGGPNCHACASSWLRGFVRHHTSSSTPASVIGKRNHLRLGGSARGSSNNNSRTSLPDQPARTRFAPSPTGYLHLGSLRTALYNYLLAKATGGQFLIRLEDTDRTRLVPDAEERLYKDLQWAGLTWDEGPDIGGPYGSYRQSDRLSLYRGYAEQLIENGHAFRCFCSKEDLDKHQRQALEAGQDPGLYSGACLALSAEESAERAARGDPYTVRFKSAREAVGISDLVYGFFKKKDPETQFIIMKSDGYPTYHFANVVDDHLMDITHVVRGSEWLISTPKHAELYQALGWTPPKFAHVGLLVDRQRQKLSKRNHDIGIDSYRDSGILPSALLNFAVLLGWRPGAGHENGLFYCLEDLVDAFSLAFTRGDTMVDPSKLENLQRRHFNYLVRQASTTEGTAPADHNLSSLYRSVQTEIGMVQTGDSAEAAHREIRETTDGYLLRPKSGPSGQEKDAGVAAVPGTGYIHSVFKIQKAASQNARDFVDRNRHLFWGMPEGFLRQTSDELLGEGAAVTLAGHPTTVAAVLARIEENLTAASDWVAADIKSAAADGAIGDVALRLRDGTEISTGAGWRFLRWALLGSRAGPQLVPLMELLGRGETMRRLQMARKIAEEVTANQTQE